jgi:hypothetical protein
MNERPAEQGSLNPPQLDADDWRRIHQALRYLARDLHHRSFAVTADRRQLLWQEMDRCLALAEELSPMLVASGVADPADHPA